MYKGFHCAISVRAHRVLDQICPSVCSFLTRPPPPPLSGFHPLTSGLSCWYLILSPGEEILFCWEFILNILCNSDYLPVQTVRKLAVPQVLTALHLILHPSAPISCVLELLLRDWQGDYRRLGSYSTQINQIHVRSTRGCQDECNWENYCGQICCPTWGHLLKPPSGCNSLRPLIW